ncbi:hypothetical protein [Stenotrophomonas humi]|nr:hypothetical protein [Stenotrophomonas humi]
MTKIASAAITAPKRVDPGHQEKMFSTNADGKGQWRKNAKA